MVCVSNLTRDVEHRNVVQRKDPVECVTLYDVRSPREVCYTFTSDKTQRTRRIFSGFCESTAFALRETSTTIVGIGSKRAWPYLRFNLTHLRLGTLASHSTKESGQDRLLHRQNGIQIRRVQHEFDYRPQTAFACRGPDGVAKSGTRNKQGHGFRINR